MRYSSWWPRYEQLYPSMPSCASFTSGLHPVPQVISTVVIRADRLSAGCQAASVPVALTAADSIWAKLEADRRPPAAANADEGGAAAASSSAASSSAAPATEGEPAACPPGVWADLRRAWLPFSSGWKKLWWEAVSAPPDVPDEDDFRQQLR